MSDRRTASTHHLEPLEVTTFGKRYYVVDDQKHVWGADLDYEAATKLKERVAGNLWSKTPTLKEMPGDRAVAKKIIALVRPHGGAAATTPLAEHQKGVELEQALASAPPQPTIAPPTNGSGAEAEVTDEGDGDDDLDSLLNS